MKDKYTRYKKNLINIIEKDGDINKFTETLDKYISDGFRVDFYNSNYKYECPLTIKIVQMLGNTSLYKHRRISFAPFLEVLLHRGANPNIMYSVSFSSSDDGTPLLLAEKQINIFGGYTINKSDIIKCVTTLLDYGADPNICDYRGNNAMHHASCPEITEILSKHGGDMEKLNKKGLTPLYENILSWLIPADISLIKAFIENGAKINAYDSSGRSLFSRFLKRLDTLGKDRCYDGSNIEEIRFKAFKNILWLLIENGADIYADNAIDNISYPEAKQKIIDYYERCRDYNETLSVVAINDLALYSR